MKREVLMTHILLLALVVSACLVRAESSSLSPVASGSPPPLLKKVGRWSRGPVYASAVSGDHVYFGSGGTIRVLKIKRKTSTWQEVASIDASGVVRDLYVSGKHLYVADDGGALIIIDISNPKKPKETGRAKLSDYVRAVFVQGNYAYLAAQWAGLVVIDVSKPTQPRVVRTHKTGGIAQDVHVLGSLALVANAYRSNGLRLIDVSNPLQPKDVGHYDMPGIAYGVFAADKFAYVVSLEHDEEDEAGLTVIDISDPTGPVWTGFHKVIYGAERVWVENSTAYLAGVANDAGLIVVDVSDPTAPRGLSGYHSPYLRRIRYRVRFPCLPRPWGQGPRDHRYLPSGRVARGESL